MPTEIRQEDWHEHVLRVRYAETDQMGVVYHANYLNWFEIGRTEMIRDAGLPYRAIEPRGLLLPVTDAELRFVRPARYDDRVCIRTRIAEASHVRLAFDYEICRADGETGEEELLVSGRTRHVWVNPAFRPIRLDREAPDVYALLQQKAPHAFQGSGQGERSRSDG